MRKIVAKAPVNIALVKYWGKKDEVAALPFNPSISFTLEALYTTTSIEERKDNTIEFYLNDTLTSSKKVIDFLRYFEGFDPTKGYTIRSKNSGPTAAGLASSASGFAALSVAANTFFKSNYSLKRLAEVTRQGSGSAVRSLLGGAVKWHTDGTIESLDANLEAYAFVIVLIDITPKLLSSREAMKRTVKTSSLYEHWVTQAHQDASDMKEALKQNRFSLIGTIMEKNALLMHATTVNSDPPFSYLHLQTFKILEILYELRQKDLLAYATMDAGPNVKILVQNKNIEALCETLENQGFKKLIVSRFTKEGARVIDEKSCC